MGKTLPNFMIIGAMRSGTTTLYKILKNHSQIGFSTTKEPHFFDIFKRYSKGIEVYKKYFNNTSNFKCVGEATASYLRYVPVIARIKKNLPNVKFIVMLRNPIDRSFSHYFFYQMFKRKIKQFKCVYKSIEDMIKKTNLNSVVFKDSLYNLQLADWFKYFSKYQFLIIQSEEYFKHPKKILKEIFDFLKIKHEDLDLEVDRINTSTRCRKLREKTRKQLQEYFEPYNKKLYKLIGKNFNWK